MQTVWVQLGSAPSDGCAYYSACELTMFMSSTRRRGYLVWVGGLCMEVGSGGSHMGGECCGH